MPRLNRAFCLFTDANKRSELKELLVAIGNLCIRDQGIGATLLMKSINLLNLPPPPHHKYSPKAKFEKIFLIVSMEELLALFTSMPTGSVLAM